jgi:diguanylate cyclase (GGDEF)-like protein
MTRDKQKSMASVVHTTTLQSRFWLLVWMKIGLAMALQGLGLSSALTTPFLDVSKQNIRYINTDLRAFWQTAYVAASDSKPQTTVQQPQALDPALVWTWPDSQFKTLPLQAFDLKAGERMVSRMALQINPGRNDLVISLPMTRLDGAHLSYRYNDGPWVQAASGDHVPMAQWPITHTSPAFPVPAQLGKLDLVLQITHQGWVSTPVLLQGEPVFNADRFKFSLQVGALLGLALVMALIGFGATIVFQRSSFIPVAFMMVIVALLVAAQCGVLGMYVAADSARFNDVAKFFTGMVYGAFLPWVVATVVSQKSYSVWIWRAVIGWLVLGLAIVLWQSSGYWANARAAVLPPYLLASLLVALGIALASVLRKQALAGLVLVAVLMDSMSVITPLARHLGFTDDGSLTLLVATGGFLLSTLLLFCIQLLQYRHGRMVMARAKSSDGRDMLTGLLNRRGFEKIIDAQIQRISASKMIAAFYYIEISDAQSVQNTYGDEGYEAGMVQMAAALSFSVTAVDVLARVAPNAFALMVVMPRDEAQASTLAQKIITRAMAVALHGLQVANTVRIAIAWVPLFGTDLTVLERRAHHVLDNMDPHKRIGWVGGAYAQANVADIPESAMASGNKPPASSGHSSTSSGLPSIINKVERELFGSDTESTEQKAQRMVPVQRSRPH